MNSKFDASLFIYSKNGILGYFLVYVDDLILTGNDNSFSKFIRDISQRFSVKDLGSLHHFLSVEVIPTPSGLLLTQHKYIKDILDCNNMSSAKEVSTPLSTSCSLVLQDGSQLLILVVIEVLLGLFNIYVSLGPTLHML